MNHYPNNFMPPSQASSSYGDDVTRCGLRCMRPYESFDSYAEHLRLYLLLTDRSSEKIVPFIFAFGLQKHHSLLVTEMLQLGNEVWTLDKDPNYVCSNPLLSTSVQADVQERVRNNTQFERFCLWMNNKYGLSNSFGGNAINRRGELQRFSAAGQESISMSVARHYAMHLVVNRDSPNSLSDAELCLSLKMGLDIPVEHQVILNGQFSFDRLGQAHSVRPNTFYNYPFLVETLETLFGSSREWYPYPGSCLFKCDAPKGQTDSQGDVVMSGFFSKGSSKGRERKQGEEQRRRPKNKTRSEDPTKKKKKLYEKKFTKKGVPYFAEHESSDPEVSSDNSSENDEH